MIIIIRIINSQGRVIVLKQLANYEESRVKLPNTQLNEIKICNNEQQL